MTLQKAIPLKLRLKLYLILALTSLILLFHSIWQIQPVVVEPADLLGLASHLTPSYWVGLALILFCSILAFVDKAHRNDALFLSILTVLGLFLFGIAIFSQEYPRDPGAYYPSAAAKNVIESARVNIGDPMPSYSSWPSIHFTTALILEVTGIDLLNFIRYFPLLWVTSFISIIYIIGKRLKLPSNLRFLLSFFVLSSYWMSWSSYSPQSIAMLLYLLCFMFIVVPRDTATERLLATLTFSALLITHSIASLAVLLPLLIFSIYRRQTKFIVPFSVLFLLWYIFQAFAMFELGVTSWWTEPLRLIFQIRQQVESAGALAPPGRIIIRYSQLSYPALYFGGIMATFTLLWRRKVKKEDSKLIISCIFWGAGILGLGLLPASPSLVTDMLGRFYLYGLIAAVCIILLAFRNQKLLIVLMMILLVGLHMPAHYGAEVAWGQILATEFKGTEFFALEVKPQEPYFYNDGDVQKLIFFHNPNLTTVHYFSRQWDFPAPDNVDPTVLNKATYLVIGKQGSDRMIWGYGTDPLKDWLHTEAGKGLDLIYNNEDFQIYLRHRKT